MKSGNRLNRTCARRRAVVLLGAGMLACPAMTRAEILNIYTWNGATTTGYGYLSEGGNWIGGTDSPGNTGFPPTNYNGAAATNDLVFGSFNAHGYTPTLGSSYNISSLSFNSSALAFTINGGPLTINGNNRFGVIDSSSNPETLSGNNGIVLGASQTWNIAAGSFTVSGNTLTNSSSSTLTKTGAGTLNLALSGTSGISALSLQGGTTQITSGTLAAAASSLNGINLSNSALLTIKGGASPVSTAPPVEPPH